MHKLLKECPECGHGTIADDFGEEITCPTCSGSGKVPAEISADFDNLFEIFNRIKERQTDYGRLGFLEIEAGVFNKIVEDFSIAVSRLKDKTSPDFSKFAEDYLKGIDRERKDSLEWGEDRYREGLEKAKQLFLDRVEVKENGN